MPPELAQLIASPFFVGAAGALVSLKYVVALGWWRHVTNWAAGTLVAGYCAPPLSDWLKLDGKSDALGVAFVLGLVGLSIIAAVHKAISEVNLTGILTDWLSRRKK